MQIDVIHCGEVVNGFKCFLVIRLKAADHLKDSTWVLANWRNNRSSTLSMVNQLNVCVCVCEHAHSQTGLLNTLLILLNTFPHLGVLHLSICSYGNKIIGPSSQKCREWIYRVRVRGDFTGAIRVVVQKWISYTLLQMDMFKVDLYCAFNRLYCSDRFGSSFIKKMW